MNILSELSAAVADAVAALYGKQPETQTLQLQKTRREYQGHFTLVTFPLLRFSQKKPDITAAEIGTWLTENKASMVKACEVVGGFLNITLTNAVWITLLQDIHLREDFGITHAAPDAPLVMVEYSSPNTNKPLHLGHVRNNLLGWAIAQVAAACGNHVVKTNIVNDRGIHICKSMLAWKKYGQGETPETSDMKGDHLIGKYYVEFDHHYRNEVADIAARHIAEEGMDEEAAKALAEKESPLMAEARAMLRAWEQGDEQVRSLWRTMNGWVYEGFDVTYKALGVAFDKIYYESETYLVGRAKVLEGLEKGLFYRREDGSVWADLTADGLDEKLLLRADGTSVYMTQDIGTACLRFRDYPIDKMIYVVGNEQNYHFQVLSLLLDRLGFKWGKSLVHFSYGMVELPNGKMKSREGTVVDADDLIAEMVAQARSTIDEAGKFADMTEEEKQEVARIVGLGALKYFLLKVDAKKNMLFNPEESIDFNGNTGPFIQYTYARIRSILRKASASGIAIPAEGLPYSTPMGEKEQSLIRKLSEFEAVVQQAGTEFQPGLIANYCYELVKEYNQFYHDCPVLREADASVRALRLMLSAAVARVVKTGLGLLGIEVPERM